MIIIHSNEIPEELYESLKKHLLSGVAVMYNKYHDRLGNPDDVRLKLLMENRCLLQTGYNCYIKFWETALDLPFVEFNVSQYHVNIGVSDTRGEKHKIINDFLNHEIVLGQLLPIVNSAIVVANFGDEAIKLRIYITICNICGLILLGSSERLFYQHMLKHHKYGVWSWDVGSKLSEYVTKNGDCVKCGLHYECYDICPKEFNKLTGYYAGVDLNKWCKYDFTVKEIVRAHILKCFDHVNIHGINKAVNIIITHCKVRKYPGDCICDIRHGYATSSSSSSETFDSRYGGSDDDIASGDDTSSSSSDE